MYGQQVPHDSNGYMNQNAPQQTGYSQQQQQYNPNINTQQSYDPYSQQQFSNQPQQQYTSQPQDYGQQNYGAQFGGGFHYLNILFII